MRKILTKKEREQVFTLKGNVCAYCKVDLLSLSSRDRTVDHIVHVYRGGGNEIENLQPCCRRCNSRRGSHSMEELKIWDEARATLSYGDFARWKKLRRESTPNTNTKGGDGSPVTV